MTTHSTDTELRICLFDLADYCFALRLEAVREVIPMAILSRPPTTPAILEGFLNLRGIAHPVVRTAALLGLPQDPLETYTPLLVLRGGELPLALLVHRVAGIATIASGDVLPIGACDSFNGCVEGRLVDSIPRNGGDVTHLLSLDRLLLLKERQTLVEYQAIESRRLRQVAASAS